MVREWWIVKIGNCYAKGIYQGVVTGSKFQDDAKRFETRADAKAFIQKAKKMNAFDAHLKTSAILWGD